LNEVLCHELAHIAVHELHGSDAAPHGEEWRALVRHAGYKPAARACVVESPARSTTRRRSPGLRFSHRCPVCQTTRYARSPVYRWRCAPCLEAGLDGILEITSEPALRL
jgi:predicted SprT family Zn-dependent metalloprotease